MASQAYYNGDWYECVSDTTAGESPSTNPEKWRVMDIPSQFERFIVQAAYEKMLPGEGQTDRRRGERYTASQILDETIYKEVSRLGRVQSQRSSVGTR